MLAANHSMFSWLSASLKAYHRFRSLTMYPFLCQRTRFIRFMDGNRFSTSPIENTRNGPIFDWNSTHIYFCLYTKIYNYGNKTNFLTYNQGGAGQSPAGPTLKIRQLRQIQHSCFLHYQHFSLSYFACTISPPTLRNAGNGIVLWPGWRVVKKKTPSVNRGLEISALFPTV